jgi:hypothetical protein
METVCGVCNIVRNKHKLGASFQTLLTALRREFRLQGFELKIKTLKHKRLCHEEFYVNAYYDAEDDLEYEIPIEVVIHHNFDPNVIWDRKHQTELLVQVFDAIVHEFKHQRQSRKRQFATYWENHTYLDDPDEIDAYSLSIAIELCRTLGKYRALRYMSRFTSLSRLKMQEQFVSPNLNAYITHFGNLKNPTLRLVAKKVYIRIQKLDTDCIFL